VTVTVGGAGTGQVVSSPPGIDTNAGDFAATFPAGTDVTISATPTGGAVVQNFFCQFGPATGDPATLMTCMVDTSIDSKVEIDITFEPQP